jgi:hypothetical protein
MNCQRTRSPYTANRFAPRLEQLSDRVVPSCTANLAGGVLTITGDNHSNDIQITDDGTTVTVACDGDASQDFTDVTKIVVKSGNGGDTVGYDLTSDGTVAITRDVDVHLGNGQDTFNGSATGDLIDGSALSVTAHGDNGKDVVNLVVDGGVATGATLDVLLCGGNGKDVVDSSYTGQLLGDLAWKVNGGNGKDELTANPTFDPGSTGLANVEIKGWHAPDTITLLVTDNSGDDGDPTTTNDPSTLDPASTFEVDGSHKHDNLDISDEVEVVSAHK